MDNLRASYRDEEEEEDEEWRNRNQTTTTETTTTIIVTETLASAAEDDHSNSPIEVKEEPEDIFFSEPEEIVSDDEEEEEEEEEEEDRTQQTQTQDQVSSKPSSVSDEEDETPKRKKQKSLSSFASQAQTPVDTTTSDPESPKVLEAMPETPVTDTPIAAVEEEVAEEVVVVGSTVALKKTKKKPSKGNCVWTKPTSRKGKKKSKPSANHVPVEDTVLITPVPRFFDKSDDSPDTKICLSKVFKAEKVELSDDRLTAGSTKGYRMVRATRGVSEGAWYFEIKVLKLGETGHTRLGWSTEKGDLQAPVGYDGNSFGYRDVDGSKVHKAMRDKYGEEGYVEGDVIGCYIDLPEGSLYAPKPPHLVWYKGQRFACAPDGKEESPKVIPGSEISFFKNGVCQGVAFKDLFGGRYYPAASMYTLPNQPNCMVKFNFGPDFDLFPQEFEGRTIPKPMVEAPYHGLDNRVENGESTEKKQ